MPRTTSARPRRPETAEEFHDALSALQREWALERQAWNAERTRLEHEVQRLESDAHNRRLQTIVLDSLVQSVFRSRSWKLLAPLRALRRLLAPRGLTEQHLIPWQQLERRQDPGTWLALGPDPQFLVPCWLPAGWVRVRLRMSSSAHGRVELYIDTGSGFNPAERIERDEVGPRGLARDFFVYLGEPARAVRFDPLDVEGEFCVEELRVEPVAPLRALGHALRGKLRLLRSVGRVRACLWRGLGMVLRGQVHTFARKLLQGLSGPAQASQPHVGVNLAYPEWRRNRQLTDTDRQRLRAEAAALADAPLVSVLMPVFDGEERYLRRAIDSVLRQLYPHWELCIADDGSTAPHVRTVLEDYARQDSRVMVTFRDQNGGIAAASNAALGLATGEYIALLDHDDELAEHALLRVAREVAADRDVDLLYSDEDKLDAEGRHVDPFFKPAWSPEYFLTGMYTCHLGVYRTSLVRELGGFRGEYEHAQDYDLALRIVARTSRVRHIPDVLYHWRMLPTSTAADGDAKPRAHAAGRRALEYHLHETGRSGRVEAGPVPGFYRVRFALTGRPRVSVLIPSAGREARIRGRLTPFVVNCVESIREKSNYANFEILVLHPTDLPVDIGQRLHQLDVIGLRYEQPFNFAAAMNRGALKASGEHLVLLNDDMEIISSDWLECLLEYSQQPEIGAVGAKLLFPDGRLQHAGIALANGNPIHPYYGDVPGSPGYFASNVVPRNCVAVTGACLMTRAELFRELGGLCEDFPLNFNDVDYCLRLLAAGRRVVYTPHAQLCHYESATKPGVYAWELEAFRARWREKMPRDPYYNPSLVNRGV